MSAGQEDGQPTASATIAEVKSETQIMGLYLCIVLLALLVGFGGNGTKEEEVALLWGTTIGLTLAHFFAFRLVEVAARGRPLPNAEDGWIGLGLTGAAVAITGLATLPYLLGLSVLDASTAASVLLLGVIGLTGFGCVRNAGGSRVRSMAFAVTTVAIAAVVTAIKYTLAH